MQNLFNITLNTFLQCLTKIFIFYLMLIMINYKRLLIFLELKVTDVPKIRQKLRNSVILKLTLRFNYRAYLTFYDLENVFKKVVMKKIFVFIVSCSVI